MGTEGAKALMSIYAMLTHPRAGYAYGDAWGSWWKVEAYKTLSFLERCSSEACEGCWPLPVLSLPAWKDVQ